jgi:hypothetical protein
MSFSGVGPDHPLSLAPRFPPERARRSGIGAGQWRSTPDIVILAQAGIQSRDVSGMGEPHDASVGIVSAKAAPAWPPPPSSPALCR